MADALTVPCPDCQAPTGTPCHTHYDQPHADRQHAADLHALDHGTCALCARPMVAGTLTDQPYDAWHPDPADAAACPPIPDPGTDWEGYATATAAGLTPGHPGTEHFQLIDLDAHIDLLHGPGAAAALDAALADGTIEVDQ